MKEIKKLRFKRNIKRFFYCIMLLIMALVILATAFLPIILSICYNDWLYMFLYLIIWTSVIFEIVLFVSIIGSLD
jgi:hypothetical protein